MAQLSTSMKRSGNMELQKNENRSYSRSVEEKMRRRKEWMIEQEKAREHERRKQRMIQEYEERRARELGKKNRSRRSSHQSRSLSRERSKSSERSYKKHPEKSDLKNTVMSEKYDSPSSSKKLFKGGDGKKISITDLKSIQTIIHRNLSPTEVAAERLDRTIENPEEIKLIRRPGEGTKPIFEREEIKKSESGSTKVEEHREVVAVGPSKTSHSSRRRSTSSPSPRRHHHSKSPNRESRYRSRADVDRGHYESSKYGRDHHRSKDRGDESQRLHRSPRSSHSRSHEYRHYSPSREYSDSRYRSRDRDSDRHSSRTRRQSRERDHRMTLPHHYMEPVPVPIYYENFGRPIIVNPMIPLRNPVPMMRRMPQILPPMRPPFNPRLVHASLPRQSGYPHPRVNRM